MPLQSMTGYGRGQRECQGWRIVVEVRSVNHRGLDLRVMSPSALSELEPQVRRRVKSRCRRGRVECRIHLESPPESAIAPALLERAAQIHEALEAVRARLQLDAPLSVSDLLSAGLSLDPHAQEVSEELTASALEAVEEALERLAAARAAEGVALTADFVTRLERIRSAVTAVSGLAQTTSEAFREALRDRVRAELQRLGLDGLNAEQLRQELVTLLDKSDITEEIVRARTHTDALLALLASDEASQRAVGKRIDFFLQELNREANTMASKSMSAELTARVVDIKVEVERLREQAHNVE